MGTCPERSRPGLLRRICSLAIGVASLLAFAVPPAFADLVHGKWELLDPGGSGVSVPSGRRAAGYAWDSTRNRLIVFGGFPTYLNDVWALDLVHDRWTLLEPIGTPPTPRYGASAVYDPAHDRLIVIGGRDAASERIDCWQLSLSDPPTWTEISPPSGAPAPRSFHVACWDAARQRVVMFGGHDGAGMLNDTWALELSGSPAWSAIALGGVRPPARDLAGATYDSARDRMVMFGGWNSQFLNDTWTLSLSNPTQWNALATVHRPPARREIPIAYDSNRDRIVLFGGNDLSFRRDTWELTLSGTVDWQAVTPTGSLPPARYGHASVFAGDRVLILGGNASGIHVADAWALDATTPTWNKLPVTTMPTRNYAAVLDPVANEMLYFGGETVLGLTQDLVAIPLGLAGGPRRIVRPAGPWPSARYAARAVWDGARDRMLMFGGYSDDGGYLNDVWEWRSRPVPGWSPLAVGGAPPPGRFAGGVVLDEPRDRLLVFGGYSLLGFSPTSWNDLWELPLSGPQSQVWSPVTVEGTPPSPRWGFAMHEDPMRARVLVVGGASDVNAPLNDVHALNLSGPTPRWSALTPGGTPPAGRVIFASVREPRGDRLVLFGGFDGGAFRSDAVELKLSEPPTWGTLVPVGGPPAGRDAITAVYDARATRLVVYGGWRTDSSYLDDTWALSWDAPVPVNATLAGAEARPDRVRLRWFCPGAARFVSDVERQAADGRWRSHGAAALEGADVLAFEDLDVAAGERVGYRLNLRGDGESVQIGPTFVDVPSEFELAILSVEPGRSTRETMHVSFTLPKPGEARLTLFDVAGRTLGHQDSGALTAGAHRIEIGASRRLAPGVYLLRLDTKAGSRSAKALVLR